MRQNTRATHDKSTKQHTSSALQARRVLSRAKVHLTVENMASPCHVNVGDCSHSRHWVVPRPCARRGIRHRQSAAVAEVSGINNTSTTPAKHPSNQEIARRESLIPPSGTIMVRCASVLSSPCRTDVSMVALGPLPSLRPVCKYAGNVQWIQSRNNLARICSKRHIELRTDQLSEK